MKNKLWVLGLASCLLNGCSAFYGYQPPAPIYGKSTGTNPYEYPSYETTRASTPEPVDSTEQTYNKPDTETVETAVEIDHSQVRRENVTVKQTASPAILALVSEADRSSQAGDLESAVVTLERALRIDSRNPLLTYKLAKLRLKQSKPRLAEDLAKKAALLAADDIALKKQSWLLISEARRLQKNYYGAKEAKLKADKL